MSGVQAGGNVDTTTGSKSSASTQVNINLAAINELIKLVRDLESKRDESGREINELKRQIYEGQSAEAVMAATVEVFSNAKDMHFESPNEFIAILIQFLLRDEESTNRLADFIRQHRARG